MIILSLGAGVQSSTLLLMAEAGEFEFKPAYAIFADTGWEPQAVYDWLDWLEGHVSIPILRVNNGNIRQMLTAPVGRRQRIAAVPFYMDDGSGKRGMGRRQCTHEYKLKPIGWKCRELLGKGRKDRIKAGAVETWIGISLDEAHRMKPSKVAWMVNRWPLIDRRMTRHDCLLWLEAHGYSEPPKSACIGCPFRNDARWRALKENAAEWEDAVTVDKIIRSGGTQKEKGLRGKQYMHSSMKPLDEVDLTTESDWGQLELFGNECEGMCGV